MNAGKEIRIREYITVLLRRRSVIALCCVILTLTFTFYGIIAGVDRTISKFHENGFTSFIYYTMVSNALAALSAAFVFPYAVEGIRKKRFTMPRWVAVMHYVATTTIAVTMVVVFAFISWVSPDDAFGGPNLATHVICPLLILMSFFQMESGYLFSWRDRLLGMIPLSVYMVVYFIEVIVIGESKGGWPDIYHITEFVSPALAIPAALLLAFGVSTAVALISNRLTKIRNKKMFLYWRGDPDPIEVRIEAFGIGRMAAQSAEKNNVQIPYDILSYLAQTCDLTAEDLVKPFVKGLLTELEDRDRS